MDRKKKKILKWIGIGLVLGILSLITLLALWISLVLFGGPAYKTENIQNYQKIYEKNIPRGLMVFPEEISQEIGDVEFSFYYKDTWNMPTVSIFLQCTYTSEAYEAECKHLRGTKKDYGSSTRTLHYEEAGTYPHPVYIAVENHPHTYEYALLSGEYQITYIYTSYFDKDTVRFPAEYLPTDYGKDIWMRE